MNGTSSSILTIAELQRLLTRVEPAALLLRPRILRRVIKRDRGLGGLGLQVPHHDNYVIDRDLLLRIADREELGSNAVRELPATLLLLVRPDPPLDRRATLLRYWRLLFHARIHAALRESKLGEEVGERIERLGSTEFAEATTVLRQEHLLLPPGNIRAVYEEFAAVYLELRYFAPHLLPVYFPACNRFEAINDLLALDVDADALFAATRLEGAADEVLPTRSVSEGNLSPSLTLRVGNEPRAYRRLLNRAERAGARGNMVRSAIFRMRAVSLAPPSQANLTRAAAQREIERFATRLQSVLEYGDDVAGDWRRALLSLLEPAAHGIWPAESRLLYDLQKVCIDRERPIFAVDLIEWFVSWGRRPIKRLLPFQNAIRTIKHLRGALHRLTTIRIAEPIRRRLLELLIEAVHHQEQHLRQRLHPVLHDALDKVGLRPRHVAEQTARDKLVEELIDRILEHGFLGMGDLRDAIARNRLKLPDLTETPPHPQPLSPKGERGVNPPPHPQPLSPKGERGAALSPLPQGGEGLGVRGSFGLVHGIKTFFVGDALIRANRRLAAELDGVYHRGEIYLRWLQRFSAAAFGTHIGRLLTLYVALPFGCSLAVLKMWDEVKEWIGAGPPEGSAAAKEAARHVNPYAFTLIGLFFLFLFHVAPFRRGLAAVCVKLWWATHWMFGDMPVRLLRSPWMMRLLQSRPWLFCYQFLLKPFFWAVLCTLALLSARIDRSTALTTGAVVFVAVALLLNSRLGLSLEEIGADSLMRAWQLLRFDIVPGLLRWIVYLFRRLQEEVERILYTADEWLRFRPGDNRLSLIFKPTLGLLWFCFTYLFRVIFNLFVEPTVNPIKHFPVVTVTAKLILPISTELFDFFKTPIEPLLGKALGGTLAGGAIFLLPGLAGFLVWEFKENWRLYRVNQSPTLRPEIVGHHGETMARLLRPGLHSGTLPKLYARLRHNDGHSAHKQQETLHHLRGRLRHFVERNLLAVLAGSRSWGRSLVLTPGTVAIATNRIRLELCGSAASVYVDFEERGGLLFGGLSCLTDWPETWLTGLEVEQERAFRDALAGFYKLAAVDVVREQAASAHVAPYSQTPIPWTDWVRTWQIDAKGKGHLPLLPPYVRLLP